MGKPRERAHFAREGDDYNEEYPKHERKKDRKKRNAERKEARQKSPHWRKDLDGLRARAHTALEQVEGRNLQIADEYKKEMNELEKRYQRLQKGQGSKKLKLQEEYFKQLNTLKRLLREHVDDQLAVLEDTTELERIEHEAGMLDEIGEGMDPDKREERTRELDDEVTKIEDREGARREDREDREREREEKEDEDDEAAERRRKEREDAEARRREEELAEEKERIEKEKKLREELLGMLAPAKAAYEKYVKANDGTQSLLKPGFIIEHNAEIGFLFKAELNSLEGTKVALDEKLKGLGESIDSLPDKAEFKKNVDAYIKEVQDKEKDLATYPPVYAQAEKTGLTVRNFLMHEVFEFARQYNDMETFFPVEYAFLQEALNGVASGIDNFNEDIESVPATRINQLEELQKKTEEAMDSFDEIKYVFDKTIGVLMARKGFTDWQGAAIGEMKQLQTISDETPRAWSGKGIFGEGIKKWGLGNLWHAQKKIRENLYHARIPWTDASKLAPELDFSDEISKVEAYERGLGKLVDNFEQATTPKERAAALKKIEDKIKTIEADSDIQSIEKQVEEGIEAAQKTGFTEKDTWVGHFSKHILRTDLDKASDTLWPMQAKTRVGRFGRYLYQYGMGLGRSVEDLGKWVVGVGVGAGMTPFTAVAALSKINDPAAFRAEIDDNAFTGTVASLAYDGIGKNVVGAGGAVVRAFTGQPNWATRGTKPENNHFNGAMAALGAGVYNWGTVFWPGKEPHPNGGNGLQLGKTVGLAATILAGGAAASPSGLTIAGGTTRGLAMRSGIRLSRRTGRFSGLSQNVGGALRRSALRGRGGGILTQNIRIPVPRSAPRIRRSAAAPLSETPEVLSAARARLITSGMEADEALAGAQTLATEQIARLEEAVRRIGNRSQEATNVLRQTTRSIRDGSRGATTAEEVLTVIEEAMATAPEGATLSAVDYALLVDELMATSAGPGMNTGRLSQMANRMHRPVQRSANFEQRLTTAQAEVERLAGIEGGVGASEATAEAVAQSLLDDLINIRAGLSRQAIGEEAYGAYSQTIRTIEGELRTYRATAGQATRPASEMLSNVRAAVSGADEGVGIMQFAEQVDAMTRVGGPRLNTLVVEEYPAAYNRINQLTRSGNVDEAVAGARAFNQRALGELRIMRNQLAEGTAERGLIEEAITRVEALYAEEVTSALEHMTRIDEALTSQNLFRSMDTIDGLLGGVIEEAGITPVTTSGRLASAAERTADWMLTHPTTTAAGAAIPIAHTQNERDNAPEPRGSEPGVPQNVKDAWAALNDEEIE